MTKQEFENRVKVQVSNKEFDAINEVYMNCDLDKDAFCKVWKSTNKTHIAQLKAQQEKAERKRFLKMELKRILDRVHRSWRWYPSMLTDNEASYLEEAGIDCNSSEGTLCCAIQEYIQF